MRRRTLTCMQADIDLSDLVVNFAGEKTCAFGLNIEFTGSNPPGDFDTINTAKFEAEFPGSTQTPSFFTDKVRGHRPLGLHHLPPHRGGARRLRATATSTRSKQGISRPSARWAGPSLGIRSRGCSRRRYSTSRSQRAAPTGPSMRAARMRRRLARVEKTARAEDGGCGEGHAATALRESLSDAKQTLCWPSRGRHSSSAMGLRASDENGPKKSDTDTLSK